MVRTFQVLTDINLAVRTGEKIVLCGPSGSGKSTLIRCINALETYQKGEIIVDGVNVNDSSRTIEAVRREVGMVFQQFNLFPHMTILENCMLAPIRSRGAPRAQAEATARRLLDRVKILIRRRNIRRNCPEANSSAPPSPVRSAWSPRSCCSTSRPPRSIPKWSRRCSTP